MNPALTAQPVSSVSSDPLANPGVDEGTDQLTVVTVDDLNTLPTTPRPTIQEAFPLTWSTLDPQTIAALIELDNYFSQLA